MGVQTKPLEPSPSSIMVSRIIVLSAAVFLVAHAFTIDPFKIDKRWERYKKAYNKTYPSDSEESKRHAIWKNNTMLIMEHNKLFHANKTTFRLGMNSHADMTATEFAARYNGFHKKHPNSHGPWNPSSQVDVSDLPTSVDWVNKGYVTPIKNQQQCGSCWAFSATGSMEGAHFKATGKLVSLSEQNLVDCSDPEGNMGCDGGLMDQAFNYTVSTRGSTRRLPTLTRRWTGPASSTPPTWAPQSSLGPMLLQAVNQICRRQWQQWDL